MKDYEVLTMMINRAIDRLHRGEITLEEMRGLIHRATYAFAKAGIKNIAKGACNG